MKTDARVRYTRHMITSAFLELLAEKEISRITVKEICEKSEINRGTFYKHYQDVYDLMEKLETEALDGFEQLLYASDEQGSVEVLTTLLESLLSHSELIHALWKHSPDKKFANRLADCCSEYALTHMDSFDRDVLCNSKREYAYCYLAGGTSQMITHWLETGTKISPQELARLIDLLNENCITRIKEL